MRSVPERPTILTFAVLIGSFIAGPFLGLQLGERFAPESQIAQIASVFAFPFAFFAALAFWLGVGVITVVFGGLRNLVRGRLPSSADLAASEALVPPGYASFVIFSLLLASAAGIVVGLLSETSLASALGAYTASGATYGFTLWLLAHHGYLPFPEPA